MSLFATIIHGLAPSTSPTSTVQVSYTEAMSISRLALTGAQTYVVDLAMMPAAGLRGLWIRFDTIDDAGAAVTTPITIRWTSSSIVKSEELSPGGIFQFASPNPVHGITALSIITTANAVVHVDCVG